MNEILIAPGGEEICLYDLLFGLPLLSPRERQIFRLIYLEGHTQTSVIALLDPDPECPVKLAARTTLATMVDAYDRKQAGGLLVEPDEPDDEESLPEEEESPMAQILVAELHPVVAEKLAEAREELLRQQAAEHEAWEQAMAAVDTLAEREAALGKEIERVDAMLGGAPLAEALAS